MFHTVTLSEAARRIDKTNAYVKGMADAMGLKLLPVGKALVMTESDFRRLSRRATARQTETASSN